MHPFRTVALSLCIVFLCPAFVQAQAQFNRKIETIAVAQDPAGGWRVTAVWTISAEQTTTPLDVSTELELRVNGVPLSPALQDVVVIDQVTVDCESSASCGGSCGSYNSGAGSLICYEECPWHSVPNDINPCDCGLWISTGFPPVPLTPGDEIMVLLRPAPGALPEPDTSDDQLIKTFTGDAIYYNRRVETVGVIPRPELGPNMFDVVVRGNVSWNDQLALNLDLELDLQVGRSVVASQNVPLRGEGGLGEGPCAGLGCGAYCGKLNGLFLYCDQAFFLGCMCGGGWTRHFPAVPIQPEDEIMILLRPAPGALPELPGFGDDDEARCCDSVTDVGPTPGLVALRVDQNSPNPFNPMTSIRFSLTQEGNVHLRIFNARGRLIRTLVDDAYPAGSWNVIWDGLDTLGNPVPSGPYFYQVSALGRRETRKMIVLK